MTVINNDKIASSVNNIKHAVNDLHKCVNDYYLCFPEDVRHGLVSFKKADSKRTVSCYRRFTVSLLDPIEAIERSISVLSAEVSLSDTDDRVNDVVISDQILTAYISFSRDLSEYTKKCEAHLSNKNDISLSLIYGYLKEFDIKIKTFEKIILSVTEPTK